MTYHCDIDNSLNKVPPMLAENGLHGKRTDEKIMFLVFALFSSCVTVYTDTAVRNLVGGRKEEEKEITDEY